MAARLGPFDVGFRTRYLAHTLRLVSYLDSDATCIDFGISISSGCIAMLLSRDPGGHVVVQYNLRLITTMYEPYTTNLNLMSLLR